MPNGLSIQPKSALSMRPGREGGAHRRQRSGDDRRPAHLPPAWAGGAAGREQQRDKAEQQHERRLERPAPEPGHIVGRRGWIRAPERDVPVDAVRQDAERPQKCAPAPISHPTGLRGRLAATIAAHHREGREDDRGERRVRHVVSRRGVVRRRPGGARVGGPRGVWIGDREDQGPERHRDGHAAQRPGERRCSGAWRAGSGHRAAAILLRCARQHPRTRRSGKRYGSARGRKPAGALPVRHCGGGRLTARDGRRDGALVRPVRGRYCGTGAARADRTCRPRALVGTRTRRRPGRRSIAATAALVGTAVRADGRLRCGGAAARGAGRAAVDRQHEHDGGGGEERDQSGERRDPVGAELAPGWTVRGE